MPATQARVVVVGAGLGGLRAAERLRALGHTGPLAVIGAEGREPYTRPPLSKAALTGDHPDADLEDLVRLRRRPSVGDADWLLGDAAVALDPAAREIELASGRVVAYDGLVLATGLTPARLPLPGAEYARHVLRTVDDALALRPRLTPGTAVVVVGAGFVGCEVAASAVARGCRVTVVDPLPEPMAAGLGTGLGGWLRALHERHGVDWRLGHGVAGFSGAAASASVLLDDGEALEAEVVVEAVGSRPSVGWLGGAGLDLTDGVQCDEALRVVGLAGAVAVGDIARWPNPRYGLGPRRVEHWALAVESARAAAATLWADLSGQAGAPAFDPVPSFWSDQYDVTAQAFGMPSAGDSEQLLEGALDDPAGAVVGYLRAGAPIGVASVGLPVSRAVHWRDTWLSA